MVDSTPNGSAAPQFEYRAAPVAVGRQIAVSVDAASVGGIGSEAAAPSFSRQAMTEAATFLPTCTPSHRGPAGTESRSAASSVSAVARLAGAR